MRAPGHARKECPPLSRRQDSQIEIQCTLY
jgi:hypothetical protein